MEPTVLLAGLALVLTLGAGAVALGARGPIAGMKLEKVTASVAEADIDKMVETLTG